MDRNKTLSILERAYEILKSKGPMRGSDLGWELWGETTDAPDRGTGSQLHNKFCRPAGKILRRLRELGLAREEAMKSYIRWHARPNPLTTPMRSRSKA